MPPRDLAVERAFADVAVGQPRGEVYATLGAPDATSADGVATWVTATRTFAVAFERDRVARADVTLAPPAQRQRYCQWAVAPFPSAVPGLTDVTYGGMDALVVPRGAKHRDAAFEFIAFVNRQDQMERLCAAHGKGSRLTAVSAAFLAQHPNPYMATFNRLADGANARPLPKIANWPEVFDELTLVAEQVNLGTIAPADALRRCQSTSQAKLDEFLASQARHQPPVADAAAAGGERDR